VPLELTATNLTEFRAGLANVDASAIYLHIVETRARSDRSTGDFAEWLRTSLDLSALARALRPSRSVPDDARARRGRLLGLLDEALESERT